MIIAFLFFHCSFVDMLNIISTCREILYKRCVDHSTTTYLGCTEACLISVCIKQIFNVHLGSPYMLKSKMKTLQVNKNSKWGTRGFWKYVTRHIKTYLLSVLPVIRYDVKCLGKYKESKRKNESCFHYIFRISTLIFNNEVSFWSLNFACFDTD